MALYKAVFFFGAKYDLFCNKFLCKVCYGMKSKEEWLHWINVQVNFDKQGRQSDH